MTILFRNAKELLEAKKLGILATGKDGIELNSYESGRVYSDNQNILVWKDEDDVKYRHQSVEKPTMMYRYFERVKEATKWEDIRSKYLVEVGDDVYWEHDKYSVAVVGETEVVLERNGHFVVAERVDVEKDVEC